jgi:hypothetical protein
LDIQDARVTDTGLLHLSGNLKLRRLAIFNTDVTDAGLAELQQALSDCEIVN